MPVGVWPDTFLSASMDKIYDIEVVRVDVSSVRVAIVVSDIGISVAVHVEICVDCIWEIICIICRRQYIQIVKYRGTISAEIDNDPSPISIACISPYVICDDKIVEAVLIDIAAVEYRNAKLECITANDKIAWCFRKAGLRAEKNKDRPDKFAFEIVLIVRTWTTDDKIVKPVSVHVDIGDKFKADQTVIVRPRWKTRKFRCRENQSRTAKRQ
ncbi:hypothetical protein K8I61_06250 [bacterium]|nr:hypothetical protein [bacterium]